MAFCFSHHSLLQAWIHASRIEGSINTINEQAACEGRRQLPLLQGSAQALLAAPRVDAPPPLSCKKALVDDAAARLGISEPIHLLAPERGQRRIAGGYRCHSMNLPRAAGHYITLSENALIGSPALCLIQMVTCLSELQWLLLAYEFCGEYVLDPSSPRGFLKRAPLTTAEELRALARELQGVKGAKTALRLSRLVANGSASPKETGLVLALCLPQNMHGCGLSLPVLNRSVGLGPSARAIYGRSSCKCDLFWPGVDVEYDSDLEHAGAEGGAHDSLRAAALAVEGIEVVHLYSKNITSLESFEAAAEMVGAKIGEKPAHGLPRNRFRRIQTQRLLFGHHTHPC